MSEKKTFSQNIYVISPEELGKVVGILDERCSTCIQKVRVWPLRSVPRARPPLSSGCWCGHGVCRTLACCRTEAFV